MEVTQISFTLADVAEWVRERGGEIPADNWEINVEIDDLPVFIDSKVTFSWLK